MKCFLCFLMHTFLRISHVLELCAKLSSTDEEKHNENIILCQGWNPSMTSALRVLRNFSICIYITWVLRSHVIIGIFTAMWDFIVTTDPPMMPEMELDCKESWGGSVVMTKVHIAVQILILTCDWDEGEEGPLSWSLQANYKASRPNCKCNIASYVRSQKLCYNRAFNEWMV